MARSRVWILAIAAILPSVVLAQWYEAAQKLLCNNTYSDRANGSGTVTFDTGIKSAQEANGSFGDAYDSPATNKIPDPTWLVTVHQEESQKKQAWSSFWFNTAGEKYWDDTQTEFDACAFVFIGFFPNNTAYLSQDDPGDCSVMLTSQCRSALLTKAVSTASLWTRYATSPPYSNLSAGVLPYLCADMAQSIAPPLPDSKDHMPKECWNDFGLLGGIGPQVDVVALTGNNRSTYGMGASSPYDFQITTGLDYECPTFSDDGEKFYYTDTLGISFDYDFAMRQAFPILTVFFQVANEEAVPTYDYVIDPSARLSCPRVTKYSSVTEVPPRLPSGTPTSQHIPGSGIHLSDSEIIGIVFGSILGILLAIGVFQIIRRCLSRDYRRQRAYADKEKAEAKIAAIEKEGWIQELEKGKDASPYKPKDASVSPVEEKEPEAYELDPTDTKELHEEFRQTEIEGYGLVEAPSQVAELHDQQLAELENPSAELHGESRISPL